MREGCSGFVGGKPASRLQEVAAAQALRDFASPLLGSLALLPRDAALNGRDGSEQDRNDDHGDRDAEKHSQAAARRTAAGDDVFGLERCRLAFFFGAGLREPLLRGSQILPAQNETVALLVRFPLDRAGE